MHCASAQRRIANWLVSKYDVIHKTGSTQRITTPPEQDRATSMGNMHKNVGEDRSNKVKRGGERSIRRATQKQRLEKSVSSESNKVHITNTITVSFY